MLSPEQTIAVEMDYPRIVCVASPGSGKTTVLVARVRHRIAQGADPARCVCITFTNAGAHEMAERLGDVKLGYIGTLHGYCFRLLQRHARTLGYRAGGVSLVDPVSAESLLLEVARELGYKGSRKSLDEAKGDMAQLVRREYRHRLKRSNLVDYDTLLEEGMNIAVSCVTDPLDELFVDEAQDSGRTDWAIYHALKAANKFIVGDVDQSIYGFRGAEPDFMELALEHSKLVLLSDNYRSEPAICEAANRLIRHNTRTVEKVINPTKTGAGTVEWAYLRSEHEEQKFIIDKIMATQDPKQCAVLCRTNTLREQVSDALLLHGIPVKQVKLPAPPFGWSDAIDFLSLSLNQSADIVTERVMRSSGIDAAAVSMHKREALRNGSSLFAHLVGVGKAPVLPTGVDGVAAAMRRHGLPEDAVRVVEQRLAILPQSKPSLADLLHDLVRREAWDAEEETEGVTVTTLHGSKGREWDTVFLPGWEQAAFPSKRDDVQEERRLAFVGITRARKQVFITAVWQRTSKWGGTKMNLAPSQFITEACVQ